MKNAKVEHWGDERSMGNILILTLKPGWRCLSYLMVPSHVEGFDPVRDTRAALPSVTPCECSECKVNH